MPRPKAITPDPIVGLIRYYGLNKKDLAHIWRCAERTVDRRLDAPESITILELRQLNRAGVPIEEIRGAIR